MKKSSLLVATVLAVATVISPVVSAVEYGGVGGRPANPRSDNPRTQSIFVYTTKGGEVLNDGVRVINNTDTERNISVGAVDSILSSGGAFSCKQEVEKKIGVGSWVSLSAQQVKVPSHDSVVVPFTIAVPAEASPGEHDGCITIQDGSMTTTSEATNGVVLGFRSAIRISLTIPGKITKHLALIGVNLQGPQNNKYTVVSDVKNDGNVSADATIAVRLRSVFGTAGAGAVGTYPVLPHSTASLNFDVNRPFWGGFYQAQSTVKYNSNPKTELGSTKATDTAISRVSHYVWVAPAPVAVAIEVLILLLIVAAAYMLSRRLRHKKHVRTAWRGYRVHEGETIRQVAEKFDVTWKRLAVANKLKAPYDLEPGQILKVPPKSKE
jgi:hypothetical protein